MISVVIIVVYLIALFSVCGWAQAQQKKQTAGKGNFLMAGKNLPMILVAMMMAGNAIGGTNTSGVSQLAMTAGLSSAMYGLAGSIAILFLGIFGASRYRKLNFSTTPEMVAAYCGSRARYLMVIGQLMCGMCILTLQYVSGGAMLATIFPGIISNNIGIAITAVAFLVLCMMGGLFGASLANLINVVVIYLALIGCLITALFNVGGMNELVRLASEIPESTVYGGSWTSLTSGLGLATILGYFAMEIPNRFTTQSNTQCVLAARDEKAARNGILISFIVVIPISFICALLGLICRVQFPDTPSAQALATVILSLNPVLAEMGLAGLWAVNISTGVALLMSNVQVLCFDIINPIFMKNKNVDINREKRNSQIVMAIVTCVTLFAGFFVTSIVQTVNALHCIVPAFILVVVSVLYFPHLLKKSTASITFVVAYVFFLIWLLVPPVHNLTSSPVLLEWPLCTVTFVLCNIFDRRRITIPEETSMQEAA